MAGQDVPHDLGMRQRHRVCTPSLRREVEANDIAGLEPDRTGCQRADADLRSLQILEDADGPPELTLDGSDRLEATLVVVMRAVAEIQAEDVGSSFEEGANHLGTRTRGAERSDNLGIAVAAHGDQRALRTALLAVMDGQNSDQTVT